MGHGNHWKCLGGTADDRVQQFLPLILTKGEVGEPVRRNGRWFNQIEPADEAIIPTSYPATPLRCLAIEVSDHTRKLLVFFTAFPYAATGGKQRLRISEIHDWGNEVEGELLCETAEGQAMVGFFDTHYFAHQNDYKVGDEHDFQLAGLVYSARCTNEETIEVTDQEVLAKRYAAYGESPERLPDGSLPTQSVHLAGMTGLCPADKYPDDAEFYCVIGEVSEFALDGIRIFQITPKFEDEDCEKIPLPRVIFGAAAVFKDGYVPKVGDSIGGALWVQGFLDAPIERTLDAPTTKN